MSSKLKGRIIQVYDFTKKLEPPGIDPVSYTKNIIKLKGRIIQVYNFTKKLEPPGIDPVSYTLLYEQ